MCPRLQSPATLGLLILISLASREEAAGQAAPCCCIECGGSIAEPPTPAPYDLCWEAESETWCEALCESQRCYLYEFDSLECAPGYYEEFSFCNVPLAADLDLRIFLEGAYQAGGTMSTASNPHLPTQQPFSGLPWNYTGLESVEEMPRSVVDWLLLETRADSNTATAARRAVLLLEDGSVVDTSGVNSPKLDSDSLLYGYVVVRSRNHLDVMSAGREFMAMKPVTVDFTNSGAAYGADSQKNVEGTTYALFAGDADGDGAVQASDLSVYITTTLLGGSGYHSADFNLDGQVEALDFNLYLANTLLGASSHIP